MLRFSSTPQHVPLVVSTYKRRNTQPRRSLRVFLLNWNWWNIYRSKERVKCYPAKINLTDLFRNHPHSTTAQHNLDVNPPEFISKLRLLDETIFAESINNGCHGKTAITCKLHTVSNRWQHKHSWIILLANIRLQRVQSKRPSTPPNESRLRKHGCELSVPHHHRGWWWFLQSQQRGSVCLAVPRGGRFMGWWGRDEWK